MGAARRRRYGRFVLLRRTRPDPELLSLFDESGRNVQRSALLLRDLLADYPEKAALARDILLCEQEGDRIVHDILHRLAAAARRAHLDSADVHALAGALDDIVDYAEEAADQLGAVRRRGADGAGRRRWPPCSCCAPSRSPQPARPAQRARRRRRSSSRSTGSRTRATGSSAPPSPICSWPASTR